MRKTDDRGFTFVELLIAVTILAIITVPLLRIFATVANTNARAKRKLEAAMAAQNLFEELKAADVDTFMQGAVEVPVLDAGGVQKKDADGNGIFMLEKEFDRTVNGKDFHMIVRLDPTSYTTAAGDAGKATDYNSIGYSQLASLSNADTAFLSVDASDVAEAVNELALLEPSGAGSGMDTSDDVRKQEIAAGLTRDITVKITKNSTSGSTSVAARITYTDGAFTCTTREAEIYSNGTNLGNTLSNIFICFNPMYNNPAKGVATETITICGPRSGSEVFRQCTDIGEQQ
jgi:prepilin-type N-terminal cleavage/methylation domain-containing protein